MTKDTHIVLHNIRSAHNVGSIFRTADAAGVSKIFLTGYTPAPLDRFGRARKDVAKVSLGAEQSVSWEARKDVMALLRELRTKQIELVAVEQYPRSIDYRKVPKRRPIAFIFGNEVRGLSKNILEHCDLVAEIPMRGKKESLNVSVAAGIVLFAHA